MKPSHLRAQRLIKRAKSVDQRGTLIIDDDGDLVFSDNALLGEKEFLDQRLYPLKGVNVGSVAWCIMWGIAVGGGNTSSYWKTQMNGLSLNRSIHDPSLVMNSGAKETGIEIFGSIRMNDTHDSFGKPHGDLDYPIKVDHPEWLVGNKDEIGDIFSNPKSLYWSALNYSVLEVRQDRLWWIRNTAQSYGFDGIDLNFFRMPCYFPDGGTNKNIQLMNQFIRDSREVLDLCELSQDRPILMGVRVPGSIESCLRIGLDVETWLKEGLIDRLLIGGGYDPFNAPYDELVQIGHDNDVPVYPCINCGSPSLGSDEDLRGAASNIFSTKADGIYLWNYHYKDGPKLSYGRPTKEDYNLLLEIKSIDSMLYLDKNFSVESGIYELGKNLPYSIASDYGQLPVSLGKTALSALRFLSLKIGDNVVDANQKNRIKNIYLSFECELFHVDDNLGIMLNGIRIYEILEETVFNLSIDRNKKRLYKVDPKIVKTGSNRISVWIQERLNQQTFELNLNSVKMHVIYKK